MMSKKQSRGAVTLEKSKTNTSTQKKGEKVPAALTLPVCGGGGGGEQTASSLSKPSINSEKSNSLSSRGGDSTSSGSKVGGSLKRINRSSSSSRQGTKQTSQPERPAFRLCSSRSFSSLHTPSLTAAPFMRSSRSLNRLDQRSAGQDSDDAGSNTKQVKKEQTSEQKVLDSGRPSSSEEQIRDNSGSAETMKTSGFSEPLESSSSSSATVAVCHHHFNKTKLHSLNRGWMMKEDESGQWQRHWFVLTDQVLRYYKDSIAEEAADVDGEINLSACFDITEHEAQRNCFQIHTRDGMYTLCAMTSGMRRNWVQAVLKNVKPNFTTDATGSVTEETSRQPHSESDEVVWQSEHQNNCLQQHKTSDEGEDSDQQQREQETKLQPEKKQSSAAGNSAASPINPPQQEDDDDSTSCHHRPLVAGTTQTDVTSASLCVEEAGSHSSSSKAELSNHSCFDECSNTGSEIKQRTQEVKTTPKSEEQQASINVLCESTRETCMLPCQQQTQLVEELEQTQKELSRLQKLNKELQDELQHERERIWPQSDLLLDSSEQALALQQLQKVNHDLHTELEAQRRSQEESKDAELRRRVDLLAQQAQLLVTGDATALAQAHLEQDRQRFHEQQMEWENCVSSLESQLGTSEERRREAESRLTHLQQELQSFHTLQAEAERLQKHLCELKTQLCANEEAQAQKEACLQKHLTLLQASQDRERRSLAASLAQAEQHSLDLQERLERAEEQVESLTKTQTWTREIEEAQQQLQEELTRTMSAVQKLQEEREQLDRRCQELQTQLSEADGEVSRLQSRLKTEETHYYNLEHSYERVCEDLQVALGKVQQRESETQDIREGYERLLDRKEQELSEVLLKMEVLGNSLEETEMKLNEVLKVCNCASSRHNDRQQQINEPLTVNESRPKATDSGELCNSSNVTDIVPVNDSHSYEHGRNRSHSIDLSYRCIVSAGDDPDRFMSLIQSLETKLYVTEEKLRDITQRLEEHQSHVSCQDPHLCSQLTQSRATTQHLGLLLHNQAKRSQRFAQETENCCRMLVGRFQVALNIVQACRERLQATPINITHFEKQLATVAACLQQGETDAEKQQHESHKACKGEDKILNDETLAGPESSVSAKSKFSDNLRSEDGLESVVGCLKRELFVVEKMLSVLQSQRVTGQLFSVLREDDGDVAHRYTRIMSQRITLKREKRTETEHDSDELSSAISKICAEAELIYAALKFQQQYESPTQANDQKVECKKKSLADISPPELAPYEEQVKVEGRGLEEALKTVEIDQSDDKMVKAKKEPEWLERLISRLQRRAKFLHQLCQEISDGPVSECNMDYIWENDSAVTQNWMQEQAKLIYLSDRLHLDLELELQQCEAIQSKLQALCKQQDTTLMDEQEAFNHTLCQLQEDNSMLRDELERAEQRIESVETGNQRLLEEIQKIEDYHEKQMQKLETKFQDKIRELQQIHEEEMKHLHGYYTKEKQTKTCTEAPDHGLAAMEDMHRKVIRDLQQQHQTEVASLLKEKDRLLQEETAATMAAIVAMRRAHKKELERNRQSQHIRESADITELHSEYEKEIQLLHKELEVLSVQHTQKCLENSQLSQELQAERKSLTQYQQENQELKKKQREIDEMRWKQSHVTPQSNDFYEMEVILRAREAEMLFLRQEACSLREKLKIARMDKIYTQNKLKALYMNNQDEAHHGFNKLSEDFKFATWSPSRGASAQSLEDTNTNDASVLKKTQKSSLTRQIRGVRSKSLKEGLSVQEKMKLFESF